MNWTASAIAFAGCGAYLFVMSRLGKWLARNAAAQSGPVPSLGAFRESRSRRDAVGAVPAEPSVISG